MNRIAALVLLAFTLAGCRKPLATAPGQSPAFPEHRPVVTAPPVETLPFEEGCKAGFDRGIADAKPRDPIPAMADVAKLAAEAAGDDAAHNEKWREGWISGYLDGFRQHAKNTR